MTRRRVAILATCAAACAAVAIYAIRHWDSIYDDAFIYLRYVRNLDAGCGLRFNCHGEAVEGFTGPLYLGALWLGSLATDQLIWWCQVLGTACVAAALAAAVVLAARLSLKHAAVLGLCVAVALAADDFVMLEATTGMETAMGAAVFGALALAVVADRPWWIVTCACAFVLVRPEGGVFVLALPLLPSLRRPRYLAAAAGFLVAMTAARYAIFGQLAPNTFYAKSGGSWRHLELGLAYLWDSFLEFPLPFLAPLALLGPKRRAAAYLLAGSAAWCAFLVRAGGDTYSYSRLIFPLVPVLSALALTGAHAAVAGRRFALAVPGGLALVVAVRAAIVHHIPEQHVHPRIVEWSQTGTYLRTHFPKGTLVATVPIGAIGYYSNQPILDLVGLADTTIARAGRGVPAELLTKEWIGHERNDTEYVLSRAPGVIVTTMVQDHPWGPLAETRAGFYADWLLLQEIKAGRAPYDVHDAEVAPGRHVLMFTRRN